MTPTITTTETLITNNVAVERTLPLTREQVRAQIFATASKKGESTILSFFGTEIELRQPSVGDIEAMSDAPATGKDAEGNPTTQIGFTQILIDYAYVPGTYEKVFDDADLESIKTLPYNEDMQRVIDTITKYTNLTVKDAEKN